MVFFKKLDNIPNLFLTDSIFMGPIIILFVIDIQILFKDSRVSSIPISMQNSVSMQNQTIFA